MNNTDLNEKREALARKRAAVASMSPMAAMGTMKAAALLAAEITDELAKRELMRSHREGAPHGE